MSAATRALPLLVALSLGACSGGPDEQNFTITNDFPANADIEVLPADESAATPSDDLANGAADPQADEINTNGY